MNKFKGDLYENFVLDHILNNKIYATGTFGNHAWLCKDTPDYVLIKAGINVYKKNFNLVRSDFGKEEKSIDFLSNR